MSCWHPVAFLLDSMRHSLADSSGQGQVGRQAEQKWSLSVCPREWRIDQATP
jgi:hypothetical protein